MKKEPTITLDEAEQVLDGIVRSEKRKSDIILTEQYLENECITDFRQKPYEVFCFLRKFRIRATSKNVWLEKERIVQSIKGKTKISISEGIDVLVNASEEVIADDRLDDRDWIPPHLERIANHLKWIMKKPARASSKRSKT